MSVKSFVMARYIMYPLALYTIYLLYRDLTEKTHNELTYTDWAWIILGGRTIGYTVFKQVS